ncbi:DNA-binding TFAR19-related protein [Staphylothermus marinus F1]|uniref:DNA-binding protein Smar_1085 n=1 Tax=Staphylothermus marinus (strain ATCC 43588 / DSM 3639 / JCM 9404 / F1) TaxID=399550 RepID=A3DNH2_STAMF|nr:DNA-binding protein [Staphylothermus marinus]ABN70182.1 DNA-binding TFAR19-related protein [Staphylothermus marinus F1]
MSESYDAELEEIKKRKLLELQRKMEEEKQRRMQIEAILRRILTPEARSRLANLRLVKPELANIVEQQLITLAQSGRVPVPITDNFLKKLLAQIYEQTHRETHIRILRK